MLYLSPNHGNSMVTANVQFCLVIFDLACDPMIIEYIIHSDIPNYAKLGGLSRSNIIVFDRQCLAKIA